MNNKNIEFNFIINKWANFYFFVQNLSNWHFSCRKRYNDLWLEKVGPLSKKEETALNDFRETRKRYPETKSIFEKAFFLSEHPFKELSEGMSAEELTLIKKVFEIFNEKFKIIYNEDIPLLEKWQKKLITSTKDDKINKDITTKIEKFYNTQIEEKPTVNCYLLISPIGSGGMANIDNNSITQELSRYPIEKSADI